jgi:uncharacterized delta-60 repeat protein
MIKSLFFSVCLLVLHLSKLSGQAPGDLDASFGNQGFLIDTLGNGEDYYADMLTLPDGKHFVSASSRFSPTTGYSNFLIKRLLSNGETDPTFSPVIGGTVVSSYLGGSAAGKIKAQSDGKFLVAGYTYYSPNIYSTLARFNSDGTLDSTFSPGGSISNFGSAVFDFVNSEGGSNILFPTLNPTPLDIKLNSSNEIFICGNVMRSHPIESDVVKTGYIAKLTVDGELDNSFSDNGQLIVRIHEQLDINSGYSDFSTSVEQIEVLDDGKILAVGEFSEYYLQTPFGYVARFNPDGTFDNSFANNGILVISDCQFPEEGFYSIERMIVHQNGSATLIGNAYDGVICRILPNGEFDNSFGNNGRKPIVADINGPIISFEELDNGKFLVCTSNSIVRYNEDFSLDYSFRNNTFSNQNIPMGSTPYFYSVEITDEGKIYLVGSNNSIQNDAAKNSLIVKIEETECALPEIDQITDIYVSIGDTTTISFEIPNSLNYQWEIASVGNYCQEGFTSWQNLWLSGGTYSGITTSELTISNITQNLDGKIYRCRVQTANCGGLSNEITLHIEEPTSITQSKNIQIEAYPNPARDFIHISSNSEINQTYQIFDVNGKIIQTGKMTGKDKEINLNLFTKGLYRFQLEQGYGLNFIHE